MIDNPTLWAMLNHLPAACYNVGKIAIMGDAAHATTPFQGQGAGQAIEDALVLTCLFGHLTTREHIPSALSAYDRVRRNRSQDVVTTSKDAMDLFAFDDGYVNGDPVRWKEVWNERMRWIWEIDLDQHCDEAVKVFMQSV
jgi:salicylate hydroxylase